MRHKAVALERGRHAEDRVAALARTLPGVVGVRRATAEEDQAGIDLVIFHNAGDFVVQVKSSARQARKHRKRHPSIPCVVANPKAGDEFVVAALHAIVYATAPLREKVRAGQATS